MLTSRSNLFETGEDARGKELVLYKDSLSSQKSGLAECLKSCSYTLSEVASETGTKVEHAEAVKAATQLLVTFGGIKGTDFAAASTKINKTMATDNAFQAAGAFSDGAFLAALSRNEKV